MKKILIFAALKISQTIKERFKREINLAFVKSGKRGSTLGEELEVHVGARVIVLSQIDHAEDLGVTTPFQIMGVLNQAEDGTFSVTLAVPQPSASGIFVLFTERDVASLDYDEDEELAIIMLNWQLIEDTVEM